MPSTVRLSASWELDDARPSRDKVLREVTHGGVLCLEPHDAAMVGVLRGGFTEIPSFAPEVRTACVFKCVSVCLPV
jgi:hypothetical protein